MLTHAEIPRVFWSIEEDPFPAFPHAGTWWRDRAVRVKEGRGLLAIDAGDSTAALLATVELLKLLLAEGDDLLPVLEGGRSVRFSSASNLLTLQGIPHVREYEEAATAGYLLLANVGRLHSPRVLEAASVLVTERWQQGRITFLHVVLNSDNEQPMQRFIAGLPNKALVVPT